MREKILGWAYAALVVAISLLALVGVLLFAWHVEDATPWKKMNAAEWGVWVGSIGTIGAFLGTIWIATTDSRTKRNEALTSARLHAAGMVWRLVYINATISTTADILRTATEADIFRRRPTVEEAINELSFWHTKDLVPLVPLQNHVAEMLAQAADQMGLATQLLKRTHSMDASETMSFVPNVLDMLDSAAKLTKTSAHSCREVARTMNLFSK